MINTSKSHLNLSAIYVAFVCIVVLIGTGCARDTKSGTTVQAPVTVSPVHFTDVTKLAGINYQWPIPQKRPLTILGTIGDGCAFLDYNNDGNLDVLVVGSTLALYRGDGHGHFVDVTSAMGLSKLKGHFLGCAVGDYDGDGYPDIYLSGYRTGVLLHNDHGLRFTNVSEIAGVKPQPWGTACTFVQSAKFAKSMDLVVCNYAKFGPAPKFQQLCGMKGMMTSCGPRYYVPLKPVYYRNLGNGTFEDYTANAGFGDANGRSLGVSAAPLDDTMKPWIAIANDENEGDLFQPVSNRGETAFRNVATAAAVAADRDGNIHGGMGVDWGDYDNDGKLDLFVSTFAMEAKSLYHNDGSALFSDLTFQTGVAAVTVRNVAFGCKFADFNNNGFLDIIIANGHVEDNIHSLDPTMTYRQLPQLLLNSATEPITFRDLGALAGDSFGKPIVGRGLAIGDYDNDGRTDVLLVDSEGSIALLHNDSAQVGHYLGIRLEGTKCNTMGIGSLVTAVVGGKSFTRLCHTDGSYLSASDSRVSFGLADHTSVDSLQIHWPDGTVDKIGTIPGDQYVTIREAHGLVSEGPARK